MYRGNSLEDDVSSIDVVGHQKKKSDMSQEEDNEKGESKTVVFRKFSRDLVELQSTDEGSSHSKRDRRHYSHVVSKNSSVSPVAVKLDSDEI
jgi:hypothetical protein